MECVGRNHLAALRKFFRIQRFERRHFCLAFFHSIQQNNHRIQCVVYINRMLASFVIDI